jgi:ferredoxin-NADP reductase
VERLEGGEVSPYLFDLVEPGDELEMRGPIGRFFVWEPGGPGPVLMIAGGSGVVPFRAMIRHRAAVGDATPFRLIYSARTFEEVIYRRQLEEAGRDGVDVELTLTRQQPEGWEGYGRRIDREMLAELMWPPADGPVTYICGPTGFVEEASNLLVDLGQETGSIRTERFGPTGA